MMTEIYQFAEVKSLKEPVLLPNVDSLHQIKIEEIIIRKVFLPFSLHS